jgi:hypothetical protein
MSQYYTALVILWIGPLAYIVRDPNNKRKLVEDVDLYDTTCHAYERFKP